MEKDREERGREEREVEGDLSYFQTSHPGGELMVAFSWFLFCLNSLCVCVCVVTS